MQYAQNDPSRLIGCPNFADFVCPALVFGGTTGYLAPADVASLQHASVASYLAKIRIPVLLDQGQVDTLFNLNEAVATYRALKAQGTPVAMLWREQGHSGGTPSAAGRAYEDTRIQAWFDHYLKGRAGGTGSAFAYYQDWTGTLRRGRVLPGRLGRALLPVRRQCAGQYRTGGDHRIAVAAHSPRRPADQPRRPGRPRLDGPGPTGPADTNLPGTYVHWQTPALSAP